MKTLKQLLIRFDWVSPNITEENFPPEKVRNTDYKLFHFDRYVSSEDVVKEMDKEGYNPANIYELLNWKDWNSKDWVVALGSSCVLGGSRQVAFLSRVDFGRGLVLDVWGGDWRGDWFGFARFLGVRNLETKALESSSKEE